MAHIMNNLIINYIPQFLTDEEFKNMFLTIGPVKSYKIVRDKATGFSYGFGFVEFVTEKDAERALKVYDHLPLYGKRIRVQHANKSDEVNSKGYNIYVKNIPSSYTETELDKLFEPFGKIVTSKVLVDLHTMQSKNVGFVLFENKSEADKAINEMNGKTTPGSMNTLYVKYADDAAKKSAKTVQPVIPHVMPQSPSQPPLLPPCLPPPPGNGFTPPAPPPGPVRNQSGNRFRFNPMAREQESPGYNVGAQRNMNMNNNNNNSFNQIPPKMQSPMPSPGCNSGMSSPSPRPGQMSNPIGDLPMGPGPFSLFVYNIGDDAEERELWALFSPFGQVQKCTVMMDQEKRASLGYGFVDMANVMEAANAIKSLNGVSYKGKQLSVSFKHRK